MQTPQTFSVSMLVAAYRQIIDAGLTVTDETSALEYAGQPVSLLNSGDLNLKITYPQDLALARHLLGLRDIELVVPTLPVPVRSIFRLSVPQRMSQSCII